MTQRQIGAHVSASGGIDKAVGRVAAIGGNALQLFSGSPRVWKRAPLSDVPVPEFAKARAEQGISSVFTHALYLVNLASDKPELLAKSVKALEHDLNFDGLIKGDGVVVHVGSHQGRGWEAVRDQVAEHIAMIIKNTPDGGTFLIENSAGQKGKIASQLEEVRWLLDELSRELGAEMVKKRVGWCLDTCHAFCAGYDLSDGSAAARAEVEQTVEPEHHLAKALDRLSLWEDLRVIHVNDARDSFASGRDRHANLGDGEIPESWLRHFLNLSQLQTIPLVLEVPGLDGKGPDAENISRLKALVA